MDPVSIFGEGALESVFHPLALFILFIVIILMILLPREKIIIPILGFFLIVPQGQQFYFFGVHLYFNRIIILLGLLLIIFNKSSSQKINIFTNINKIDKSVFFYIVFRAFFFSLHFNELSAVVNQVAFVFDSLGTYCLFRSLTRSNKDVDRILKSYCYFFFLIAIGMLIEQLYEINIFSYIGGSAELDIRNEDVRSYASFRHPLTAGTTGAAIFPILLFFWYRNKQFLITALGIISSSIIVFTAHSSGPLIAFVGGITALIFWPFRNRMKLVRWVLVGSILALHIVMKAPVWFLIARIDLTGSSSSYHRANLVDQFINHFWDWWLIGTPDYHNWGWFLWDVQNQYVSAGVEGGLVTLFYFIAIFVHSFSLIGKALKNAASDNQIRCLWALGASTFSYTIAFFGVNLFDQSMAFWFMLLVIISTYTASISSKDSFSKEIWR